MRVMDSPRPFDPREPHAQQPWEAPQQSPPYSYPDQWQQQPQQAQWQNPQPQQPPYPYPGQPSTQYPYPGQPQSPYQAQPQYPYLGQQQQQYPQGMVEQQKSWIVTVLLCHFLGTLGVHRFYTGHIISGIFQLLTFGGFGIWVLIDIIMILTGDFKDQYGRPLYRPQVVGGNKSWVTTALLCLFLGEMGIHRFYTGHIIIGLFQFFTFGGFGIWTLVDLILIYTDNYTDSYGMRLTRM